MPEDISMLLFFTNNFSVIEKENFSKCIDFWGKNGITCTCIIKHIKTVYIHMNWPYSYLKCCLKSHFLRLTINWNIYIYLLKNLKWYKCAWCHLTYSHQVNTCRWWQYWSPLHLMSYCVCPSCLTTISTL